MSLGVLGKSLGAVVSQDEVAAAQARAALNAKYPWHTASRDTLSLQTVTNEALQAAGYCPIPSTGILDGSLCGARNHLTIHSREFFGNDMLFSNPPACEDPAHANELRVPTPGCFKPTPLKPGQAIGSKLSRDEWILIGGAFSLLVAGVIALKSSSAKRA
jgi:hypothetical protein